MKDHDRQSSRNFAVNATEPLENKSPIADDQVGWHRKTCADENAQERFSEERIKRNVEGGKRELMEVMELNDVRESLLVNVGQ
jgi:hypothetical protein